MQIIWWISFHLLMSLFIILSYLSFPFKYSELLNFELENLPQTYNPINFDFDVCVGGTSSLHKKKLSKEELTAILKSHSEWLEDSTKGKRASLCNVDLKNSELSNVNFSKAYLEKVDFTDAELFDAVFDEALIIGSIFWKAGLADASFDSANLIGVNFEEAFLVRAEFPGAVLIELNMKNASVFWANFSSAIFEPNPGQLPILSAVASLKNLSTMRYLNSALGLKEMRQLFKNAGLHEKEREITFALKRSNRYQMSRLEGFLDWLLFDLTCQYGLSPRKPLYLLLWLILPFSLIYYFALRYNGESGIWIVSMSTKCEPKTDNVPKKLTPNFFFPSIRQCNKSQSRVFTLCGGLYFSLLSAFDIGWREVTLGAWIARLQTRDYRLKPLGWVRTVSGVQSLVSFYLFVLWILVYFSRPFE